MNLKKSMTIVALAVFVSGGIVSCTPPKPVKEVGLQLWSVRDDMKTDAAGTIEKVGAMGYKFIEAAGYKDGQFYGMEPTAFKELVDANGLNFYSSHCGQAVPDSANWETTMTWWDTCIAAHQTGFSVVQCPQSSLLLVRLCLSRERNAHPVGGCLVPKTPFPGPDVAAGPCPDHGCNPVQ